MKSILFTLTILLPFIIKAQPESVRIGEIKEGVKTKASMNYILNGQDTTYALMFNNEDPADKSLKVITFRSTGGKFNEFYSLVKSTYGEDNIKKDKYRVDFKIGKEDGYMTIRSDNKCFIALKGGYLTLTNDEADALFGKRH